MAVELSPDDTKQAVASMRRFASEELDVELSEIQLLSLLRYFLTEIAPTVYNRAIADAQVFLRDRLADLDATCYEPEFVYWPKGTSVRRK
jgi:uncharacterized protein (DUF2164 family)